jgi:GTP-binding protein
MSTEQNERSQFIDHARITVRGGRGGDGCMSFRREKYVDMGGPDGGNGGRGGDVYIIADPRRKSLLDLTYRPHFHALDGSFGRGANKYGRGADDLTVIVPVGTVIHKDGKVLIDMKKPDQKILIAHGGRGGRGNAAFKTHRNVAPMLSEKGEPGEEFVLELELKVLADIGLIGCPNAGKSTLLARLTSAQPKIAAYPFTTLNPNLGVAEWRNTRLILADIPGLIEGAHTGKGLGHDFLRHIERTRMLFHMVDIEGYEGQDAAKSVRIINKELSLYSPILAKKEMVIVANKMDLTGARKKLTALRKKLPKHRIFAVSGVTGEGLDPLLAYAAKRVAELEKEDDTPEAPEPIRFVVERDFEVERVGDVFRVKGKKGERFAAMTQFDQPEGLRRFQNILKKMGVEKELALQGAKPGDLVKIGKIEFFYEP